LLLFLFFGNTRQIASRSVTQLSPTRFIEGEIIALSNSTPNRLIVCALAKGNVMEGLAVVFVALFFAQIGHIAFKVERSNIAPAVIPHVRK
jgi:hypothetical protein